MRRKGYAWFNFFTGMCLLVFSAAGAAQAHVLPQQESNMRMHHLHLMMNHGLGMTLKGESLVMQGQMGMSTDLDALTIKHGREMIGEGGKLLTGTLSGEGMQYLHKHGHGKDAMMGYTHKLGDAMLDVVKLMQAMPASVPNRGDAMGLHHMHVLLAHALDMALEGDELVMLGRMNMAGVEDKAAIEHGKAMMKQAQALWDSIMHGKAMQAMHGRDTGKSELMRYTHRLGDAVHKVMDLLQQMPA